MKEFIEERLNLVRQLADKGDPFTKVRLLNLAERYDEQLHPKPSRATRKINMPIGISTPPSMRSSERG
jgi:hypothetical protein